MMEINWKKIDQDQGDDDGNDHDDDHDGDDHDDDLEEMVQSEKQRMLFISCKTFYLEPAICRI